LPLESLLRYGKQIGGALAHTQGRGIIHRDIKSAGVTVTPQGFGAVIAPAGDSVPAKLSISGLFDRL
jgi:serine/threonine protein kinase